jgi:hypothetical protein
MTECDVDGRAQKFCAVEVAKGGGKKPKTRDIAEVSPLAKTTMRNRVEMLTKF